MTTAVSKVNDEGRGADAIEQSDQPEGDEREAASDDTDHDSRTSCGNRPNQRSLRDPQPRSKILSNVVGHFSPLGDRRPDFPAHLELRSGAIPGPDCSRLVLIAPSPSQIRCPIWPGSRPRRRPGLFRQKPVFIAMWVGVSTGRWIRPRPLTPSGGGAGPVSRGAQDQYRGLGCAQRKPSCRARSCNESLIRRPEADATTGALATRKSLGLPQVQSG